MTLAPARQLRSLSLALRFDAAANLPAGIVVDERRLRQALLNLLGNAVKFTDTGSVTLRAGSEFLPGSLVRLRFEVEDTGTGIAPEAQDKIFLPFEQAGDINRRSGGAGLGLAISRVLALKMNGTISVQSALGRGSCFRFEIVAPAIQDRAGMRSFESSIIGYEGPRRRVLVVDDTETNRTLLADFLSGLGFEMQLASDGVQGMAQALAFKPDLILMDLEMPVLSGPLAIRQLRDLPEFEGVSVIGLSASATEAAREAFLGAGANAFLAQPISFAKLLAEIGPMLGLTWTHSRATTQAMVSVDAADPLIVPPVEEIDELVQLARLGNMRRIHERADHLVANSATYRPFAEQLHRLADQFQTRAIVELLVRCRQEQSEP